RHGASRGAARERGVGCGRPGGGPRPHQGETRSDALSRATRPASEAHHLGRGPGGLALRLRSGPRARPRAALTGSAGGVGERDHPAGPGPWPQVTFSGQTSSPWNPATVRRVGTMIAPAIPRATRGSTNGFPVASVKAPATTGASETSVSPRL